MLPRVSVIMPWYNTKIEYVQKAVKSVLQQVYKGSVELVICNDGSNKNLTTKLENLISIYTKSSINIKVIHHSTNQGISYARNSAVEASSGDWIIWLDSDDELAPSAIDRLIHASLGNNYKMILGSCLFTTTDKTLLRDSNYYLELAKNYTNGIYDPLAQVIFSIQPQIISKAAFEETGGFDPNYLWAEMTEFFLRFTSRFSLNAIKYISLPLYIYHRRQSTHSGNRDQIDSFRKKALMEYAKRQSIPFQKVSYFGRSLKTGAQHYLPEINEKSIKPPYHTENFVDYQTKTSKQ